jgi:Autographiviridae RNA polymerase
MDTMELPKDTDELHIELLKSAERQERLYKRAMSNVGYGGTVGGQAITRNFLGQLTEAVNAKLNSPERPRSNTLEFKLERVLRDLKPELLALCILQSGLHAVAMKETQRGAYLHMALAMHDECWAAGFLQSDRKLARKVNRQAKDTYSNVRARRAMAHPRGREGGLSDEGVVPGHAGTGGQLGRKHPAGDLA